MKINKYILFSAVATMFIACNNELTEEVALSVDVTQNENVSKANDTYVVKKGQPVQFTFAGDPDNIAFFSGEADHEFQYRDRDQVSPEDITSSKLTFSVWAQYGNGECTKDVLKMMISEDFAGLNKKDFNADSMLVESHKWKDLVPQAELPQAPGNAKGALSYEIDLKPYLGKRFALAISYTGHSNKAAQPRMNFVDMKIENKLKNGTTSTLYAGNFGFTPLNMMWRHNLNDQKNMKDNRAYGTVTNNMSGIWNLKDAGNGNFFIHSSGGGKPLKYSWLVSDLIMSNACSPDQGVAIKNITKALNSYSYTYNKTGEYKATFVATNSNYKHESRVIREIKVKVVD